MTSTRRGWLARGAGVASALALPSALVRAADAAPPAGPAPGVLRVAVASAETGFDPPQVGDNTSLRILACIFEAPLTYDYVARPPRLVPLTAAALPEMAADFRSLVLRIRPGIRFADDPAFGGVPRELTAADYAYSFKRYVDPRVASEHLYIWNDAGIVGLAALREQAQRARRGLDYDAPVDGLRVRDRHTLEIRFERPNPRFAYVLASPIFAAAVAREVVERHGADIAAHPVGTGPFRLAQWRRASRIVLERNPRWRGLVFDGTPAPGDALAEQTARALHGARLPRVERIEVSVIVESQPRWLAFESGAADILQVPPDFGRIAAPGGRLAPHLAKRGVRLHSQVGPDIVMTYFNMRDPVVGGNGMEQVALRRAVALAWNGAAEIALVRDGAGIPAQSILAPQMSGYDPALRSEMSEYSPARANALLDLAGYADRDADGWRERPDGSALLLRLASTPAQLDRRLNELWRKNLAAIGVRVDFEVGNWGDLLKRSLAGSLMMWGYSWGAPVPDGAFFLGLGYGPNAGQANDARFSLPAFDRLYERQAVLPDGAERDAVMRDAARLLVAYMPYKIRLHPEVRHVMQPWVRGWWDHPFRADEWIFVGTGPAA